MVDHNHKYWDSFAKAIKHEGLEVSEEEPQKEISIKIINPKKSSATKQKVTDTFKIACEYIDEGQSILEFFAKVEK